MAMTPRGPRFSAADRLLVLAPHPDDESLATGGLIQVALAAQAAVRVIVATDGDDNPWPQRWIERRWRIDAAARARWGRRRREECAAALAVLGLGEACVVHAGWPDLGLTGLLMRDGSSQNALAAQIDAFAPTHVALPDIADHHPDHSALHVLAELALARTAHAGALRLAYLVHGTPRSPPHASLALTDAQQQRKLRAVFAHASQTRLSGARLLRFAARPECFETATDAAAPLPSARQDGEWRIPLSRSRARWFRHEVLLVLRSAGAVVRLRVPLATGAPSAARLLGDTRLSMRWEADHVVLDVRTPTPLLDAYVKIQSVGRRVFIYDRDGWRCLHDTSSPGRMG